MLQNSDIPKPFQDFMKEAEHAIKTGEPLADFYERMQDYGFVLTYRKRNFSEERAVFLEVIRYFNKRCATNYKEKCPSAIADMIINRYREGNNVETMKRVIHMKACAWQGTPMEVNLAPHVIFDRVKFESYAGQLRPISRPAPPPSGLKPSVDQTIKPPIRKPTLQELVDNDVKGMRDLLEELYLYDSNKQNIFIALFPINLVWSFLHRLQKIQVDEALYENARKFAQQKIEEYKTKDPDTDTTERHETCRRYYIIKSLFKGQSLNDVKGWVLPEQFINIPR